MPDEYPSAAFVNRLLSYGSDLGRQLDAAMPVPLREYLRSLFCASGQPRAVRWLDLLLEALFRALKRQGRADADEVCAHFARMPVLQQSDHSNLLLDTETLLNNYLFQLAAREAGARFAPNSQCSTVVCFSQRVPPRGPVFLSTRDALLNVFGLSKTTYKNASFCALPGPLTLRFEPLAGCLRTEDPVLSPLLGRAFPAAPDAYQICNDEIWRQLRIDTDVRRIQVDESMTSEAIALHIEDPDSPVHHLLFDSDLCGTFLTVKREVVDSVQNIVINRAEPDWFWYRRGARLHAMIADRNEMPIPYHAQPVARELRNGNLYGDRILSYLVRCILPGAVAVGGTVQQDYVWAYRQMLIETNRRRPFLTTDEAAVVARGDLSRLGGAPLIELNQQSEAMFAALGPDTDLAQWADDWLDKPVGVTAGRLDCAWFYEINLRRVDERKSRKGSPDDGSSRHQQLF